MYVAGMLCVGEDAELREGKQLLLMKRMRGSGVLHSVPKADVGCASELCWSCRVHRSWPESQSQHPEGCSNQRAPLLSFSWPWHRQICQSVAVVF